MSRMFRFLFLMICFSSAVCAAPVSNFFATHQTVFDPGKEFPGASGSLRIEDDAIVLEFDFSKGGHYVAAQVNDIPARPVTREIVFETDCPEGVHPTLRLVDATGQTFQAHFPGDTDGWETFVCVLDDLRSHWGGANDGVFHQPLARLAVLVDNNTPKTGSGPKGLMRLRFLEFRDQMSSGRPVERRAERSFGDLIDEAGRLRDELQMALPELERSGLGAKTRATVSVMNDFFPWLLTDVARGHTNRAVRAAWEMVEIGRAAKERLARIRSGEEWDRPVPHFVTGPTTVSHAQIVGTREWPDGRREHGNVFLTGFGHFGMVQRDLAKLPPLGNNILQMEVGPRAFLPQENVVNTNAIRPFVETATRAARENVQICLLLSPHYFPGWAMKKWPSLADCKCGFFGFCVYDENARSVIEKYLRIVIPLVRGNPALHSVCLSNEPVCGSFGKCRMVKEKWPLWLERTFGTVGRMNAEWETSYASFRDVPVPAVPSKVDASPESVEFVRFKHRAFASFHKWMAGVIHEMAPEIPVHVKAMVGKAFWPGETYVSVDVEQFSALSDYNGNDIWDTPRTRDLRGWAHEWSSMEASYDFQRSARDVPIFNSENHVIPDRMLGSVSGRHIYAALWQNAVHGQSATAAWTWERAYDDGKADTNGLFLERPACLEAWAHCALDLSRLADELAPIQNLAPTILLHYSLSSQMRDSRRGERFLKWYRAANGLGQPLGVATERMLADYGRGGAKARPLDSVRALLLPDDGFIPASVQKGIDRLASEGVAVVRGLNAGERELARRFEALAGSWNLPDLPRVTAPDSGKGVFGVESRGYRKGDKSIITVVNHMDTVQRIRFEHAGRDLITGAKVPELVDLPPQTPMLVEMPRQETGVMSSADAAVVSGLGPQAGENRRIVQRAVDAAAEAGGGRVEIPEGLWPIGSIELKSGVELHLRKGAILKGSVSPEDYNANDAFPGNRWNDSEEWSGGHLVYGHDVANVAITGEGTIDGNGPAFFGKCDEESHWPGYKYGLKLHPIDRTWFRPGPMVAFFRTKGIRIEGVSLVRTPCWTCHVLCCEDVMFRSVTIDADRTIANSDGFSIDCTRNVTVEKCVIKTGDDGIAVRASCREHAATNFCENICIRDCDIWSCCYAIRFGIGSGTIRNIDVTDTRIHEAAAAGFGFTTAWIAAERNCYIEDIRIRNCTVAECVSAVVGDLAGRDAKIAGIRFEDCVFKTLLPMTLAGGDRLQMSFANCIRRPIEKLRVRHRPHWRERDIRNGRNAFADIRGDREKIAIVNCKPEPFGTRGVLLLSFDDRNFADWEKAIPLFGKYGAHATFFFSGEFDPPAVRTAKRLMAAGHAVGLHGQHHANAPEAIAAKGADGFLADEVTTVRKQCQVAYIPARTYAYPNCRRDAASDELLLGQFERLRAGLGKIRPYDPKGEKRADLKPLATDDRVFFPVDELPSRRVLNALLVGEAYNTDIDDLVACVRRAGERKEALVVASHGISPDARHINMKTEWLEKMLAAARESGVSVLGFDEIPLK